MAGILAGLIGFGPRAAVSQDLPPVLLTMPPDQKSLRTYYNFPSHAGMTFGLQLVCDQAADEVSLIVTFALPELPSDRYAQVARDGDGRIDGEVQLRFVSAGKMQVLRLPKAAIGYIERSKKFFALGVETNKKSIEDLRGFVDALTQPYVEFGFDISPSPMEGDSYLKVAPQPLYLDASHFDSQAITRDFCNVSS